MSGHIPSDTIPGPPPENIGPYRIEAAIGEGGMGTVYRAYHQRLARSVALKRVRTGTGNSPELRERLLLEAQTAARMSHPNIVQVYDIVEGEDGDWLVMELAEGETLLNRLEAGPLEIQEAMALGLDVAKGLAAAHALGIVHRDLKAENVMIAPDGRAKILDFGLAYDEASTAVEKRPLGTPRAMSPEQAKGDPVDHRADLFSLGILLYEALTGISPFLSTHGDIQTLTRICVRAHRPLQEHDPNLPPQLCLLVDRLLEKEPSKRPRSAEEVVVNLQKLGGSRESPVKVLFVDDEPLLRSLVRDTYKKRTAAGELTLELAESGEDALERLAQDDDIALVITDIGMPGMNGLDLLEAIKTLERPLLTVVVSAHDDLQTIRSAMNLGAFDFLTKPLDMADLERTRQKAVAELGRLREHARLRRVNRLLDERNRIIRDTFSRYLRGIPQLPGPPLAPGGDDTRTATLLQVRFDGYAELPDLLSSPTLATLFGQFLGDAIDIVRDHGGTLFDLRRDTMRILFGLPLPQDGDARRALQCARSLSLAMAPIRRSLASESKDSIDPTAPEPFGLCCAVDTGEIRVDYPSGRGYQISGSPVDRVTRLLAEGVAGETLISGKTLELQRTLREEEDSGLEVGPVFTVEVDGHAPFPAHRLVSLSPVEESTPRTQRPVREDSIWKGAKRP